VILIVNRYIDEIGMLDWAAPQDWMCEASALRATGLSVKEHQIRTVNNFVDLRDRLGEVVVPVLQGWSRDSYLECEEMYDKAGIDLNAERVIGLGSICRRNADAEITQIIEALQPLRLHGFGVKGRVYQQNKHFLTSADSMAWSFWARYEPPLDGCTHQSCANCRIYALQWREKVVSGTIGIEIEG
jgi:hypothetical protein